jgi:hypothetical protein
VRQFEFPACVIVKHANPCGVARAEGIAEAYAHAYRTDPTSAFGGVIAFNRELDAATARAIVDQQFVEVILAPSVSDAARELLASKDNVRVLLTGDLTVPVTQLLEYKSVAGGLLVQTRDQGVIRAQELRAVTQRVPTLAELDDLIFAWRVAKYVKSNAIVCVKHKATLGIGAGQMSRVVSSKIAALKAKDAGLDMQGSSIASDAYFPFRDGLDALAELGIKSVIQPGGSKRDAEVIAAADEHGIAMVFTGMRHFRHYLCMVLIIGGGGREHALAWKCAQSPRRQQVIVAPGNAGTALEPKVRNIDIAADDIEALLDFAMRQDIALTIVGPEGPLVAGIVDRFTAAGRACFGPSKAAARLEGSKAFTKDFLKRHGIPTAGYASFTAAELRSRLYPRTAPARGRQGRRARGRQGRHHLRDS